MKITLSLLAIIAIVACSNQDDQVKDDNYYINQNQAMRAKVEKTIDSPKINKNPIPKKELRKIK